MTVTILWLIAILFIVVGLLVYFYEVIQEERRRLGQRESSYDWLEGDAKELIVTSLTSSDPYQRQAMAKQLADFDVVDDVIMLLLQEMAEGDDDRGVRKTAAATLQSLNK
jgi:hypothetical protein